MSTAPATTSPLQEIEQTVLARARDLGDAADAATVHGLVAEAVAEWSADHRRGRRPHDLSDPAGITDRAIRNLTGYGPLAPLLADDDVWEIMINAPDQIFVKRHRGPDTYHHEAFHDDDHVVRTLTKILADASASHRKLDPSEGLQDAQLDDGSRLHIVHSDIGRGGHLIVNIRKFGQVSFHSLDQLVDRDMLTPQAARFLKACVRSQASVVFAGVPGSGKTTLLSCCCAELDPGLRVVVAEEVFEAEVPVANTAHLQTRPSRADRQAVDLRRLVAGFLRMAPDVAIVGEVRDAEALPLLLTLSSGVKGFTTIHAGSARQALTRLRFICQLAGTDVPLSALNALVTEAVDVVVHTDRTPAGPRVTEILAVEDLAGGPDAAQFTATTVFAQNDDDRALDPTGLVPSRLSRLLARRGVDVQALVSPSPRERSSSGRGLDA